MLQFYTKDERLARLMPLTREKDNYTIDHQCFFLFFNRPDSYYNNVGGNEVIKIVPSQLQRVNMSHSSFFQQDLFVFNVGPHNVMFYDVVLRQRDRLLCSVQKEKNTYKNTKYVFYVTYQRWVFHLFYEHQCFWTLLLAQWSSAITCIK